MEHISAASHEERACPVEGAEADDGNMPHSMGTVSWFDVRLLLHMVDSGHL